MKILSHGRARARERYATGGGTDTFSAPDVEIRTDDGSEPEEGTDAYYARQEEKLGIPERFRHYGDPEPAPPRRGRPAIKGKQP